jgi:hypothetical protein
MSWPDGPRFHVSELRGYSFGPSGIRSGGDAREMSSFMIVDGAYRDIVRTFREASNRSRHAAYGLALYVCAALNSDPGHEAAKLRVVSISNRMALGYSPTWQYDSQTRSRMARSR